MDGMQFTFTTLALIVLIVILLLMFVCHFFGGRNSYGLGIGNRSACSTQSLFGIHHSANGRGGNGNGGSGTNNGGNKEKIGLSAASKLFQANGYVLHSGSEFLLSTSGSFKRFDTVDREDYNNKIQQQQRQTLLGSSAATAAAAAAVTAAAATSQQQTTPLWNLAQQNIPPQPLRPAPQAPDSAALHKTVTFSLRNELPTTAPTGNVIAATTIASNAQSKSNGCGTGPGAGRTLISCMKYNDGSIVRSKKIHAAQSVPQLLDPPPAPASTRLITANAGGTLSNSNNSHSNQNGNSNGFSTVIPRPLGLRQTMSLQNAAPTPTAIINKQQQAEIDGGNFLENGDEELLERGECGKKPLQRRMSNSTNPFLCEAMNETEPTTLITATTSVGTQNVIMKSLEQQPTMADSQSEIMQKNPFLGDIIGTHEPFVPQSNGEAHQRQQQQQYQQLQQHEPNEAKPTEAHLFRNRSFSETDDELKSLSNRLITAGSLLRMHATNASANVTATATPLTAKNPFNEIKQKMKGPHLLQKTISEDFLFRKIPMHMNGHATPQQQQQQHNQHHHQQQQQQPHNTHVLGGSFRHAAHAFLHRQNSTVSLGGFGGIGNGAASSVGGGLGIGGYGQRRTTSQCSLDSTVSAALSAGGGSMDSINLMHGISCDSVDSDTSSAFISSLDQTYTQITGYLRVGLHYDKNANAHDGMMLTVSVLEAKDLICPLNVPSLDTFVRIYLVPDQAAAMQTEVYYNSETPVYDESFECWLKKQPGGRHSLWFHLYHTGDVHTLIGEAEMEISEIPRPIITWIPLSDSRKCNAKWGELMFSLSYLPTAERLTIVIVKARNLKREICTANNPQPQKVHSVFVKIYLMNNEKKVLKKRTSMKRCDRGTIFNEAMIFSVPPHGLTTVQLRLTVFGLLENNDGSSDGATPQSSGSNSGGGGSSQKFVTLGHVIAGSCSTGKGLRHWHQMLSSLRKPVAMWHVLRAAANQPVFSGGAEAVVEALQQCGNNTLRNKRNSVY